MSDRLAGRTAFVTGAGSGIARASALRFAGEGAQVVVAELDPESGGATVDAVVASGGDALLVQLDATDEASVRAAFAATDDRYGRLDVLFNCVGGSTSADSAVDELDLAVLDRSLALDLRSTVLCSREAVPRLRAAGGGAIVNMTSFVAFRGTVPNHAYVSAKGAVAALTRAMAGSYAASGIRVNAIAPGVAATPRAVERVRDPKVTAGLSFHWDDYPFAIGEPEDIANVALFLASEESRMVTGHVLMADGGLTAY